MNTNYEAIILAGGDAWGLKPDTWVDKAMLKLGKLSLLEYQIRWLARNGIKHIIVAAHREFPINDAYVEYVTWSIEEYRKGTGGATLMAVDKLKYPEQMFYLMNVDDICFSNPVDILFPESQAKILVSKPKIGYGKVELRQEIVLGFKEKPFVDFYVSCGHYGFKKHIVDRYFPDNGDIEYDVLPKLAEERILLNQRVQRWMTINTYKDYINIKEALEDQGN